MGNPGGCFGQDRGKIRMIRYPGISDPEEREKKG
jgi:hypothetical protein